MAEQEQAEFRERNRLAVQQTRSQQAAQHQLPNQNQVESESFDGLKKTLGGLLDFLKNPDDPDKLFGGTQKNPEKAVLLHHLSSGLLRFDQCKDCGMTRPLVWTELRRRSKMSNCLQLKRVS
jgi:hypothetical protein